MTGFEGTTQMGQIVSGIRGVLSHPKVYDAFQKLMGARRGRLEFAEKFIRARLGDRVLDVGCGTARILEHLPEVEYWGYDISPRYIAAAKERFGNRGRFFCREFGESELEHLPNVDLVLAIGVLHHLDDNEAITFLRLANRVLRPGGRLVSIDPCFTADQNALAHLLVSRDRGRNVRTHDEYLKLAREAFTNVRGEVRHRIWTPYTHWIMECTR